MDIGYTAAMRTVKWLKEQLAQHPDDAEILFEPDGLWIFAEEHTALFTNEPSNELESVFSFEPNRGIVDGALREISKR